MLWRPFVGTSSFLRDCCEAVSPVGHILVLKSMHDKKHSFLWKPSMEKLLNRRHHFYHVLPCCNAMQAFPTWEGKGMKPTWVLIRELKLALGNMAVPEHRESPALWMETAAPRAGTSRAECSCWMLDAGCWTSDLKKPMGKQLGQASASTEGLHGDRPSKTPA